MGADLYIRSISDAAKQKHEGEWAKVIAARDALERGSPEAEAAQDKVDEVWAKMYPEDGYFRDSYNSTSVLWTLGLSWWKDVGEMLDKNGFLSGANLKKFRQLVAEAAQVMPSTVQELKAKHCDADGADSVKEWHEYWIEKRKKLLAFLDKAIEMNEPIYCSI